MPSEHFSDCKTSLAQKPLLDYKCSEGIVNKITVCWIYSNRHFVKKLKTPQISSKSHEMTCLRPKQSMNSLLGVKIAQTPYFWFGYNSSKWRKITHWTCSSTTPNKSPWEFLYPVKKWSPKNSFSKRKNLREHRKQLFYWLCFFEKSYILVNP